MGFPSGILGFNDPLSHIQQDLTATVSFIFKIYLNEMREGELK